MNSFSEADIEKYLKYTDETCGELLSEVELPEGPEKKVVCLKDRDYFVEEYEELQELGEI